jgi:hypothetical protein
LRRRSIEASAGRIARVYDVEDRRPAEDRASVAVGVDVWIATASPGYAHRERLLGDTQLRDPPGRIRAWQSLGVGGWPDVPGGDDRWGKTWRIAGPVVNVPAAQGGVDVAQAGVVNAHTWFMCCGLSTVVDVTPDAGKHWWVAFLPGEVVSVVAGTPSFAGPRARLIALVRPFATTHSRQRLWIYVSANGRLWRYDPSLKSIY